MNEFKFPVVNGMVAVEHVRYLQQERDKLVEALKRVVGAYDIFAKDTDSFDVPLYARKAKALLLELGEKL